jgi:hypothetical protein
VRVDSPRLCGSPCLCPQRQGAGLRLTGGTAVSETTRLYVPIQAMSSALREKAGFGRLDICRIIPDATLAPVFLGELPPGPSRQRPSLWTPRSDLLRTSTGVCLIATRNQRVLVIGRSLCPLVVGPRYHVSLDSVIMPVLASGVSAVASVHGQVTLGAPLEQRLCHEGATEQVIL